MQNVQYVVKKQLLHQLGIKDLIFVVGFVQLTVHTTAEDTEVEPKKINLISWIRERNIK